MSKVGKKAVRKSVRTKWPKGEMRSPTKVARKCAKSKKSVCKKSCCKDSPITISGPSPVQVLSISDTMIRTPLAAILNGATKLLELARTIDTAAQRKGQPLQAPRENPTIMFSSAQLAKAFSIRLETIRKLVADNHIKPTVAGGKGRGVQHQFNIGEVAKLVNRMSKVRRRQRRYNNECDIPF